MKRTCPVCHEPLEECLPMDQDLVYLTATEREQRRPLSKGLLCLDCKLAARGWQPAPYHEYVMPPRTDWPTDSEGQRKRLVELMNGRIISDMKGEKV
jgi:hypothetical protein